MFSSASWALWVYQTRRKFKKWVNSLENSLKACFGEDF